MGERAWLLWTRPEWCPDDCHAQLRAVFPTIDEATQARDELKSSEPARSHYLVSVAVGHVNTMDD